MKLSVVILNYNVRYFLEVCLRSVEAAIANIDAEIIVIDNHSSDDSCAMVKQLFPSVHLIENKENSGFSKGNNKAVAQAKGEYLCILNPDTIVSEDSFVKLLDFSAAQENLGIVGCQLIDGRGHFLPESKRHIPTPKVAFQKVIGCTDAYYANHLQTDAVGPVAILVGAFMWMKRAVYQEVGGFDEAYFMYGEDIDLSYKVKNAGYHNFYYGATSVIHFKGESTLKDAQYAKRFYGAMQIFYKKHFKKHVFMSVMVWLGIKMAQLMRPQSKAASIPVRHVYAYTQYLDPALIEQLPQSPQVLEQITSQVKNESMVVYDFKLLKPSAVMADMKRNAKQDTIVFRFLSKNCKFILGSDSASSRGEVLRF